MLDINPDEYPPKRDWADVQRHWTVNILPECLEKANEDGLGPLVLTKNGKIRHNEFESDCLQVTLCLGLIALRAMAEAMYLEEHSQRFLDEIVEPFMKKHERWP